MSSTDPIPLVVPESSTIVEHESRPQAEPLPSKRGEIGFVEGVHSIADRLQEATEGDSYIVLPVRHPADRDQPPSVPLNESGASSSSPSSPLNVPPRSLSSMSKSSSIFRFLKPQKSIGGVQSSSFLIFLIQVLILGGTITGWVFATKFLKNVSNMPSGLSSNIFVHVVFIVGVVAQLIFLERRLFRMRGERYSYLHPGQILPRHRNIPMVPDTAIAFAPWNRPPLPTYAAALAQSGVGTGDVEDHLIAVSPPPAYGNTRGSTLILAGFLRDSLRSQRPRSAASRTPSVYSQSAHPTSDERRLSYVSRDEEWEEVQDADRARRLEETLSQLEAPAPVHSRS